MAIDPVLLCKECKHCKIALFYTITTLGGRIGVESFMYRCSKSIKPGHDIVNPVTGPEYVEPEMPYCDVERTYGGCGPTAKNWAPKHKKDLFKMLTKEQHD